MGRDYHDGGGCRKTDCGKTDCDSQDVVTPQKPVVVLRPANEVSRLERVKPSRARGTSRESAERPAFPGSPEHPEFPITHVKFKSARRLDDETSPEASGGRRDSKGDCGNRSNQSARYGFNTVCMGRLFAWVGSEIHRKRPEEVATRGGQPKGADETGDQRATTRKLSRDQFACAARPETLTQYPQIPPIRQSVALASVDIETKSVGLCKKSYSLLTIQMPRAKKLFVKSGCASTTSERLWLPMYSDLRIPWVCLWLWCSLADVLAGCPMRRGPLKPSQSFDAELCSVTGGLEICHGKWVFRLRFALELLMLRVRRLAT